MLRRPPRSTRTDTLFPYTTLFRSTPALVLAGWADGYRNTPLEAVQGLGAKAKAILGPWVHKYPHFAWPKPRMDFHAVARRFWDRWLKGIENGAENDPKVVAYLVDAPRPARSEGRSVGTECGSRSR